MFRRGALFFLAYRRRGDGIMLTASGGKMVSPGASQRARGLRVTMPERV
jgi:hypothetical protein